MNIFPQLHKKIDGNRVLLQNFSALTVLQLSNYLLPLITFPYLVRVLGPDKFGLMNFAAAFIGYFGMLTDYGFNLSATKEISLNRNNRVKIGEIISAVIIIKTFLFLCGMLIFFPVLYFIDKFYTDSLVYLVSFLSIIGNLLSPNWFYQGIERMRYIAFINVFYRTWVVAAVFIFIKESADLLKLVAINSISAVMISLTGILLAYIRFKIPVRFPDFKAVYYQLKEGWYVFISTLAISLYTVSNTFILGLFADISVVGYFTAADKIRHAIQGLFSTVTQTVYPHLSALFGRSVNEGLKFVRKLILISGTACLAACLVLFIFTPQIVELILGTQYLNSVPVLRIISFLPFIILIGNIFGVQTLLNLGFSRDFSKVIVSASLIHLLISFVSVPVFFQFGTAVSAVITELFVTFGMYFYLRKKGIILKGI